MLSSEKVKCSDGHNEAERHIRTSSECALVFFIGQLGCCHVFGVNENLFKIVRCMTVRLVLSLLHMVLLLGEVSAGMKAWPIRALFAVHEYAIMRFNHYRTLTSG